MSYQQLEDNVKESFKQAKRDIIRLQAQVIELGKRQEEIMHELINTNDKENSLYDKLKDLKQQKPSVTRVTKIVRMPAKSVKKAKHTHYLASKTGKTFHVKNCPFAKNIRPKSKIIFKTKTKALNKGYKPCKCATK